MQTWRATAGATILRLWSALAVFQTVHGQDSFDLALQYSPSQNPNGQWAYGLSATNGDFEVYRTALAAYGLALQEWRGDYPDNDGSAPPDVILNPTELPITVSDTTWLPHQVTFHPGQNGERSVVRWTAPGSGVVDVGAEFEGRSAFVTSGVEMLLNGSMLYSNLVWGAGAASRLNLRTNLPIQTGDVIDFRVNTGNGSWTSDTTQISVHITVEPAPWLTLSLTGGASAVLGWPTNALGYRLEKAMNLEAAVWVPVTNSISIVGTRFQAPIDTTTARQFFRLSAAAGSGLALPVPPE